MAISEILFIKRPGPSVTYAISPVAIIITIIITIAIMAIVPNAPNPFKLFIILANIFPFLTAPAVALPALSTFSAPELCPTCVASFKFSSSKSCHLHYVVWKLILNVYLLIELSSSSCFVLSFPEYERNTLISLNIIYSGALPSSQYLLNKNV